MKVEIRTIAEEELVQATDLVWRVFSQFEAPDYPPQGVDTFRAFIEPAALAKAIRSGEIHLYGYYDGKALHGVAGTRGHGHLCLLFVEPKHHRQGIAKALVKELSRLARQHGAEGITVNSSPFAVEVYHKMGFADTGPQQVSDGITFTPMKKNLF